ncbi:transposase, undefined [Leifsonia xyli subsp. cynodontis DSM 46306]|uniref:L-ribulose-5-phosphate 4-epimerase n=2 Tax=Leifsonia xyli TaxID=1575 RepID=U3PCK7_LEIXC|nr:transposase, undefined [Leifsonia xyli subsp. cynodontis DSM 46306]
MLEQLKKDVCEGNLALARAGLVAWTGGNLSARDREAGVIVIKPSAVRYDVMTPADMVVVDVEGRVVEGQHGPSSDTASHLGIYRGRDDVNSIVHTHSTYATAFAAVGREIPCCMTAIADEFGGPVPCGGYAPIGGDAIGREMLSRIGRSPAILMRQHGVFTIGASIEKALQAAVIGRRRGPHGCDRGASRASGGPAGRRDRSELPPLSHPLRHSPGEQRSERMMYDLTTNRGRTAPPHRRPWRSAGLGKRPAHGRRRQ